MSLLVTLSKEQHIIDGTRKSYATDSDFLNILIRHLVNNNYNSFVHHVLHYDLKTIMFNAML